MRENAFESQPYPSARRPVFGRRGMVAASQPLAAQAGLQAIVRGGNAVDAALCTAIALTVLEPTSNGLGSDAFAFVWANGALYGLNASGRAPAAASAARLRGQGLHAVPHFGWEPVTVPGAVSGWAALHERFGRLKWRELFESAITYAEQGYPVPPVLASNWRAAANAYRPVFLGPEFAGWFPTFAPDGRGPRPGEVVTLPDHARSLRILAEEGASAFYSGELAQAITRFSTETGGRLNAADLAAHTPSWVEPLSVGYRGYTVHELPPNGQGLVALQALAVLEGLNFSHFGRDDPRAIHLQIEAIKLAFEDAQAHLADPDFMRVAPEELLGAKRVAEQRARITPSALIPAPSAENRGGTVYFCAADGEGMMVSFIQSNYAGFGSGVVVPGTGIALHNRGANFTLQEGHSNELMPGKRPYHTIMPGFLSRDGQPVGPFGVMGGFMQPQGHVQVLVNALDFGLNPQAALDAPRWQWLQGQRVEFEPEFAPDTLRALTRMGHDVRVNLSQGSFGRGQIIWRHGAGLVGASEPRADGQVVAW